MNKATNQSKKTFSFILAGLVLFAIVSSSAIPVQAKFAPASSPHGLQIPGMYRQNASSVLFQDPPEITVDDTQWTYTGTWSHPDGVIGAHSGTLSHTDTSGAFATYTFTGSAVTLYSKTWNDRGKMNVYLDDTLLETVNLYTASAVHQNPVFSTAFPYGTHTIKMEWAGIPGEGGETMIILDKLTYSNDPFTVDDRAFTYAGTWSFSKGVIGAFNRTLNSTDTPGAFATYTFTGSAVILYSKTWNDRGKMNVYLDDTLLETVNLYTASAVHQNAVFSAAFPYGTHTIKMEWAGIPGEGGGTMINIDKLTYLRDTQTVDDRAFTYAGTWSHPGGVIGAHNGTLSSIDAPGAFATYTFTGSALTLYSKTWNDRGKMNVYLDDTLLETVDLYTASAVHQNAVFSTAFPYGSHTIKVEWTGAKNLNSSGTMITLDKITYFGENPATPTPTATFTPTATPTLTPTPTVTPPPNSNGFGTCWRSEESWAVYTVPYSIDRNSIPVSKGWDASILGAVQTWNDVEPSRFLFTYSAESENVISFGELQDPNRNAAETEPFYLIDASGKHIIWKGTVLSSSLPIIPDSNPPTRLEWDTNNVPIEGNPDSNGSTTTLNVQNVLTHELGHWLELLHPTDTEPTEPDCYYTTMASGTYPGDIRKITLEDPDREAINFQYR